MMTRRWLYLWVVLVSMLVGCASVSSTHSFQFLMSDNTKVKLLNWEYSSQRAPAEYVKRAMSGGKGLAGAGVVGLKPVGDYLYVKWQIPPSTEIHEARVDLRPLLPWNMNHAEVRPSFNKNNELEIYLAVPDKSAPNVTRFKGMTYVKSSIRQIYPVVKKIDPSSLGG